MKQFLISFKIAIVLMLIVCGIYPLFVWAVSQGLFPHQANGSLVTVDGKVVGSNLLAQNFTKPEYFHPRPSAAGSGYDPTASGGTNLGPTSAKLIHGTKDFDGVEQLAKKYRAENGLAPNEKVPVDAVTRSASGLDPDISVPNAMMQAGRIAAARKVKVDEIRNIIDHNTQGGAIGVMGTRRVNVLQMNIALDKIRN